MLSSILSARIYFVRTTEAASCRENRERVKSW